MRSLNGGVCQKCKAGEICAYSVPHGWFECRALDYETDCPTCPPCVACGSDDDCGHCESCVDGHCSTDCDSSQYCCEIDDTDVYQCFEGNCCVDADCTAGQVCENNTCSDPPAEKYVCGNLTATNLAYYVEYCRSHPGECSTDKFYAFNSIDLSDHDGSITLFECIPSVRMLFSNIVCCDIDEDCCCDYTVCSYDSSCQNIYANGVSFTMDVSGTTATFNIQCPFSGDGSTCVGGNTTRWNPTTYCGLNWLTQSYTCQWLKDNRDDSTTPWNIMGCDQSAALTDAMQGCFIRFLEYE